MNRSEGHRNIFSSPNLSEILESRGGRLERADNTAYFVITPELEGYYSCGTSAADGPSKSLASTFNSKEKKLMTMLVVIRPLCVLICSSGEVWPSNKHEKRLCRAVERWSSYSSLPP